jgi:signal transduction histidine kinase
MNGYVSLRWKLTALIAAGSVVTAAIAAAGFCWFDLHRFWELSSSGVASVGSIVADQAAPAIMLGDRNAATDILSSLRADPIIQHAVLYGAHNQCFAEFQRVPVRSCPPPPADGIRRTPTAFVLGRPLMQDGERLGTLRLEVAVPSVETVLGQYLGSAALIFLLSLVVAAMLAMALQTRVSAPILAIARVAEHIAQTHRYEQRVTVPSRDELGELAGAFNSMIGDIERRDVELASHRKALEQRALELQALVNEKDRAHQELAEAQQNYIRLSRLSGMAEVATSVLHNVGNVLNSVNVSATVVSDRVRELPTDNLVAVAAMLKEHQGDIGSFLTADPKGGVVLPYLSKLGEHFKRERQALLVEAEELRNHVDHIKGIVSTQQSYAKVSGLMESVSLPELMADACRILQAGFERHQIRVEHEYEAVPPFVTEKHAIMQIFLNLVRNAKDAVKHGPIAERCLRIRIYRQDETSVGVQVIDTGVGIAPQNLTSIFSHGFTTKSDGHGFGLHSSALDAQRMGGSLSAASEGLGRGATFTLILPLTQKS